MRAWSAPITPQPIKPIRRVIRQFPPRSFPVEQPKLVTEIDKNQGRLAMRIKYVNLAPSTIKTHAAHCAFAGEACNLPIKFAAWRLEGSRRSAAWQSASARSLAPL